MTFEYYYNKYFTPLTFFAKKMVKDEEISKDVVQSVFIKTWKLNVDLSVEERVTAYLYAGVKNSCVNALRVKRMDKIEQAYEIESPEESTNDFIQMDYYTRLFEIVRYLPEECRKVIILYYKEGYHSGEISKLLGLAKSTVKNHMSHGIQQLKQMVKYGKPIPKGLSAKNSLIYTLRMNGTSRRDICEITGITDHTLETRIITFSNALNSFIS